MSLGLNSFYWLSYLINGCHSYVMEMAVLSSDDLIFL